MIRKTSVPIGLAPFLYWWGRLLLTPCGFSLSKLHLSDAPLLMVDTEKLAQELNESIQF
ncbi:MAG: hypothetical protein ABJO67_00975 [Pseudoruegeria sp.]